MNKIRRVLGGEIVDRPAVAHASNLKTIVRAAADGALATLECKLKATGERCAVLAVISKIGDEYQMTPFCIFMNGNPFELLEPEIE